MASLNFAEFAKAISDDDPCGPDLEDDTDFMNVTARLEVAWHKGIGGQDQIVLMQLGKMLAAPWPVQCQHA